MLAATCYSIGPIFIKLAYGEGLEPITIVLLRTLIGALFLVPIYLKYTLQNKMGWKIHLSLLLLGLMNVSVNLTLVYTLQVLPASITILLLYLYPIFIVLISSLFLGEKISYKKALSLVGGLLGVVLIVYVPQAAINTRGMIMAVGAAILYSIMVIGMGKMAIKVPPLISSAAMLSWGGIAMLFFSVIFRIQIITDMTPPGLAIIILLACISTVMSVVLLNYGLLLIGALHTSVVMNVEPLLTTILAVIVLNEQLTVRQSFGIMVIIGSLLFLTISSYRDSSG